MASDPDLFLNKRVVCIKDGTNHSYKYGAKHTHIKGDSGIVISTSKGEIFLKDYLIKFDNCELCNEHNYWRVADENFYLYLTISKPNNRWDRLGLEQ